MPTAATLTRGLVRLIRAKEAAPRDLETTSLYVLDAVASALAGRRTEPGRILLGWAEGRAMDAGRRAFLMGALAHILELDDLHRASVTHPGCVVVPAALALAPPGADGPTFLAAVLHGCEAMARVGMAAGPAHYRVWHNTATCGPFGAAMAAAALLGLDDDGAVHALGNAGTQSAGLWEFLATGAMSKHLHAGRAAEAGLVAAELAARGFTGPPAILEGTAGFFAAACPDAQPDAVLHDPAAAWQVHATSIKPWPSCRHTHPAIDAALELSARLGRGSVSAVEAVTYPAALALCDRPEPESEYAAKFSLQHCIAAALGDGSVGLASFDAAAQARLAGLRRRVRVSAGEPYAAAYPGAWGSAVIAILDDGTRITAARDHCKGDPEAPLSRDEMIAKARELFAFGGAAAPDQLIAAILAMADGGPVPRLDLA